MGKYELNKLTLLPMCGFIAQLVEHCTGIAEVTGSNPVEALIFFQASSFQFHCMGKYELNKLTLLPMCGFIAQLVEHCTGIAEVTGSNPVEALIFFQASSFQLLKLENLLR